MVAQKHDGTTPSIPVVKQVWETPRVIEAETKVSTTAYYNTPSDDHPPS